MSYTTKKTRERLAKLAYEYNISNNANGYAINLLYVRWATPEDIELYFAEIGKHWWKVNFPHEECEYLVVDTICENEYGSMYSNDLWSLVPLNELPYRMAKQVANMLNNGINYCEL